MSFTSQLPLTPCSSTCPCQPALRPTPPASDSGSRTTAVRGHFRLVALLNSTFKTTICLDHDSCLRPRHVCFFPPKVCNSLLHVPSGKKEEVWVIDDLIIDGSSLHNPPVVMDSFEEGPNESNWLFFPGGNTGLYCPYQKTGL